MGKYVHKPPSFVSKYPLDLRTIVSTPMIFRESVMKGAEKLPYPNTAMLRDFAEFAGYGYGALRAAISRARAIGELSSFVDAKGTTRYRTTELARSVGIVAKTAGERPGGFVVAVISFRTEEESPRSKLRDTLKYFGFRRIAQNTLPRACVALGQRAVRRDVQRGQKERRQEPVVCHPKSRIAGFGRLWECAGGGGGGVENGTVPGPEGRRVRERARAEGCPRDPVLFYEL